MFVIARTCRFKMVNNNLLFSTLLALISSHVVSNEINIFDFDYNNTPF